MTLISRYVRRGRQIIDKKWRRLTSSLRYKPAFLIIGTEKGGTSSLFQNLRLHPNIILPTKKEMHFFQANYSKGINWYRAKFPLRIQPRTFAARGLRCITGEATVDCLFLPYVAERVGETFPDIRLIVMLRDPAARAASEYAMMRRAKRENDEMDVVLREELDFLRQYPMDRALFERFAYDWVGRKPGMAYPGDQYALKSSLGQPDAYPGKGYLLRGFYYEQLSIWFEHFKRDQFLILKSEDYFADPTAMIEAIVPSYLGIPTWQLPKYTKSKQEGHTYSKIDAPLREELAEFFRPYNQKLYHLLGVDFGW